MYWSGNPEVRAEKFFELCQADLAPYMEAGDKEFLEYFPKMLEISYEFMIRLYEKFKASN